MKVLIKILGTEMLFLIVSFLLTILFAWFVTSADSFQAAITTTINSFSLDTSSSLAWIKSIPEPMIFFFLGLNILFIGIYLNKKR